MKILLINNGYPSPRDKQYCAYIADINECLQECGHSVEILTLRQRSELLHKVIEYVIFYAKLLLKKYAHYDLVYLNNYSHIFLGIFWRNRSIKKMAYHWHGTDVFAQGFIRRMLVIISRKTIKPRSVHFAPSHYFREAVSEVMCLDMNDIYVSPSGGINVDLFAPSISTRTELVIGFASHLSQEKGLSSLEYLIKEKSRIERLTKRSVKFKVIDYGVDAPRFKRKYGDHYDVIIQKKMAKAHMASFYNGIDILFMPTNRKAESLGLVSLEAMSCNVPVLGVENFALKEYILPGITGEFFTREDLNGMVKILVSMLLNLNRYEPRMFILHNYARNIVVKGYKNVLSEVL